MPGALRSPLLPTKNTPWEAKSSLLLLSLSVPRNWSSVFSSCLSACRDKLHSCFQLCVGQYPQGFLFLLEFHDLNNNACWSPREALNNLYIKILHRNCFKTSYPFMTQSIFPIAHAGELCKYLCLHPGYYV